MRALVDSSGFLVALLTGTGASLVAAVITPRKIRAITFGAAAIVAVVAGLRAENVLNAALPAGLLVIAAAALATEGRRRILRATALVPGGVLLVTLAAESTAGWARALAFVTIIGAALSAAALDRCLPYLTFVLLAISALGAYATVPDTEEARALVGALVPVAAVTFFRRDVSEPVSPSLGISLVAWVALVGGTGRPGSVVGAIGCLGVLALGLAVSWSGPVLVLAVHVPVVVVASRVVGVRQSAATAAIVLLPVAVVAVAVLMADGRRRRKPR